jgi:CRISPR type I-E-associated protein CasB/Cse2
MSSHAPSDRATRFVEALRRAQNDRGKMASLRKGLSPATVMDAWPVVAALGGQIGQPGESVHVDIAALFATHPQESDTRNFGETCRAIALADSSDNMIPESHERRFRRLLACDLSQDLSGQLRTWIRLAASKGVGVSYEKLFDDLTWWSTSADRIRVRWAQSFWRSGLEAGAASVPETIEQTATP